LVKIENDPDFDYDKQALLRFESELDISLGDFDKKEEINTDMAIFKWSNKIFMSEEEIKDLTEEQKHMK